MKTQFEQRHYENMRKNQDNYVLGIFYFNPEDPRVILPKRNKWMGWTLNFASPFAYIIITVLVTLAILI